MIFPPMSRCDIEFYACQDSQYWEPLPNPSENGSETEVEEKEDECSDEEGEEIEKETYKEAEECVHKEEDEYEMIEATTVDESKVLGGWLISNGQRVWIPNAAIQGYYIPAGDPYTTELSSNSG